MINEKSSIFNLQEPVFYTNSLMKASIVVFMPPNFGATLAKDCSLDASQFV